MMYVDELTVPKTTAKPDERPDGRHLCPFQPGSCVDVQAIGRCVNQHPECCMSCDGWDKS